MRKKHTTNTPATKDTKPRRSARIEKSKVNESQEESETAGLGALKLVRSAPADLEGEGIDCGRFSGWRLTHNER